MQPPQEHNDAHPAPRHGPRRTASIQTLIARAGFPGLDEAAAGQPLVPAIAQTTVYTYPSLEALEAVYGGEERGHIYYRQGHANGEALEAAVAALEGAEAAVTAASGMAAISAGMLATLAAGDHVLADHNVYGGTHVLLTEELARLGIAATLVDAADEGAMETALRPETRLLHLEALSNPMLRVCDLPRVIDWAKARGLTVTVDNTFATPALMRPIEHGADLVFHSLPKYLGGHSAAMGGVAVGRRELVEAARARLMHLGGTLGPFDAWMALGGLKTLGLRMRAHSENALAVARYLAGHPAVMRVEHPGLPTHPQHALAQTLYPHGTGGMLAFEVARGHTGAARLVRALAGRIPLAPSLADVATTISYPAGTSHRSLSAAARAALGISDGLLRLSVGIEDSDDILADLEEGLAAVR